MEVLGEGSKSELLTPKFSPLVLGCQLQCIQTCFQDTDKSGIIVGI